MKEVKFKIDASKIVQACHSITNSSLDTRANTPIVHMAILEHILSKSLEIESSQYSDKERRTILKIIKNRMYEYFLYNRNVAGIVRSLHCALNRRDSGSIKSKTILLINEVIAPNTFIYSPEHGIRRRVGRNEKLDSIDPDDSSADLSARICTLEIDAAGFSGLEGILQLTSESLDRESLLYTACLMYSIGTHKLKKIMHIEECYTLSDLYTLNKDTGVPLVDYGLRLLFKKYYALEDLARKIKAMGRAPSSTPQIAEQISEVFSPEDLKIIISIKNNLENIKYEKRLQNCMAKTLEYMQNSTNLLEGVDGSKTLRIKLSLSDFYAKYVASTKLEKLIQTKRGKLHKEIETKTQALREEKAQYKAVRADLQDPIDKPRLHSESYSQTQEEKSKETENKRCAINKMQNEIYLLKCASKKENMQSNNIRVLLRTLRFLPTMDPSQKIHVFNKIEEFGRAHDIEIKAVRYAFATKHTRAQIFRIFIISFTIYIIVASILLWIRFKK
ncbi:hypothetical protein NEMIN01_2377 [Nematocida minor]|uniref:uncharacterized protein n=1 Tax=Nematocida minor TaxID=1912983 RepID=UPI00221F7815|nr:uncharacterized protein NEMIN01_2377 [Nematocida minor]KAI5193039.1 hypothetical protein NEMIN01_2377 [Nematocida minor]